MISLVDDAKKYPISNAIIILLLFLIMASFPITTVMNLIFVDFNNVYFAIYFLRIIFSGVFLFLFYKFGLFDYFKIKVSKNGWFVFIAVMLIALNNFPFVSLALNYAGIVRTSFQWQYLLAMISVAFSEEIVFRGFILAFLTKYFVDKPVKRSAFWVIVIDSAVFALAHLINLFNGANLGATLLQVSYTFLIGVTLALLALKSKNIILPFIAHFIYNVGGNLPQYGLLYGMQWSVPQVVITVIISLAIAVYIIRELILLKDNELVDFLPESYKN